MKGLGRASVNRPRATLTDAERRKNFSEAKPMAGRLMARPQPP